MRVLLTLLIIYTILLDSISAQRFTEAYNYIDSVYSTPKIKFKARISTDLIPFDFYNNEFNPDSISKLRKKSQILETWLSYQYSENEIKIKITPEIKKLARIGDYTLFFSEIKYDVLIVEVYNMSKNNINQNIILSRCGDPTIYLFEFEENKTTIRNVFTTGIIIDCGVISKTKN